MKASSTYSNKLDTAPKLTFSEKYDLRHAQAYFDKHQDGFWRRLSDWRDQKVARKALELAGNPKSVLDLPCGTGRFWSLLTEEKDRKIIACDYSQDMIDIGMQHRPPTITKRISTLQSSAFQLDLPDGAVDNIFCIRLLHHIGNSKDRLRLLAEMHRVARSSVIISLWVDGNVKSWRRSKLESKRARREYQNRFVIPRSQVEKEFEQAGFDIKAHLDFLPGYAMWRTYVLEKK
jgi:ubiquinone/menaquinone biosynthesis C-methylase UbiE